MKKFIYILILFSCILYIKNSQCQYPILTGWPDCNWVNDPNNIFTSVMFSEPFNCSPSGNWTLIFEDNFDGSQLDPTKWIPRTPWGDPDGHCTYNLPENIVVENGNAKLKVLKITPQQFPKPWWHTSPVLTTYSWTGAEMWTIDQFQYGRFEMKCTIPNKAVGYWPAFWTYGCIPGRCDEIDIFEFWNEWTSYCLNWINWDKMSKNQHINMHVCETDALEEHMGWEFWTGSWIFSVEWTPFTIKWFVNNDSGGNETLIRTEYRFYDYSQNYAGVENCEDMNINQWYGLNLQFPTVPMSLIASFKMGLMETSMGPRDDTPSEGTLTIDYIRAYEQNNSNLVIQQDSMGNLKLYPTNVYAKDIIFGNNSGTGLGEITGEDIYFRASENIILKPNFHIKPSLIPIDPLGINPNYSSRYSVFSAKNITWNKEYDMTRDKVDTDILNTNKSEPISKTKSTINASNQKEIITNSNEPPIFCKVAPNPSDGNFNLIFSQHVMIKTIEIYNELGVMVKNVSNTPFEKTYNININNVSGIYLLNIQLYNYSKVIKIKMIIN